MVFLNILANEFISLTISGPYWTDLGLICTGTGPGFIHYEAFLKYKKSTSSWGPCHRYIFVQRFSSGTFVSAQMFLRPPEIHNIAVRTGGGEEHGWAGGCVQPLHLPGGQVLWPGRSGRPGAMKPTPPPSTQSIGCDHRLLGIFLNTKCLHDKMPFFLRHSLSYIFRYLLGSGTVPGTI